ncbi:MAG: carbohydrate kinase family protein [Candidatus Thorarchaeota archaeon]
MEAIELEYNRLIKALETPIDVGRPVILPDFYVDHFVIAGQFDEFIKGLTALAKQGGGNLLGNKQFLRRGGNSVNTASALLALGLNPVLIITTDDYGSAILPTLVSSDLDLSHVHTDGRLSSTVSIELEHEGRRVNLMVSDSGSAAEFSFSDLTERDLSAIQASNLVALLNLNHNPNAPELAHDLFEMVGASSKAIRFMDVGDPSGNLDIVEPLARNILGEGLVDIVSLNENEARWFAWAISGKSSHWEHLSSEPEHWLSAAKLVSTETGTRIDLHTQHFTASIMDDKLTVVPTFNVVSRIICGAGDAWNAGDIFGTLQKLEDFDRLSLANAVASQYVSSVDASHPTRAETIAFLRSEPSLESLGERLVNRV